MATARERLPQLLADADAAEGVWVEDKGSALAVHTRRAADPAGALAALREPLAGLAADVGLVVEPGRLVIELRPPGMDKGAALTSLVAERKAGPVLFAGDDLGDLAAFAAVRALRGDGHPGLTVCSASGEVSELAAEADLVVDGPGGVAALLGSLARSLAHRRVQRPDLVGEPLLRRMLRPGFGQESRPALTFGIRHAQRLVQGLRRLGDVEGVDHQRVLTELGHAPASRDSTSAQPRSERSGPSLATRFMPSLIGLTSSTSASR